MAKFTREECEAHERLALQVPTTPSALLFRVLNTFPATAILHLFFTVRELRLVGSEADLRCNTLSSEGST
jgi:hypothetical protein